MSCIFTDVKPIDGKLSINLRLNKHTTQLCGCQIFVFRTSNFDRMLSLSSPSSMIMHICNRTLYVSHFSTKEPSFLFVSPVFSIVACQWLYWCGAVSSIKRGLSCIPPVFDSTVPACLRWIIIVRSKMPKINSLSLDKFISINDSRSRPLKIVFVWCSECHILLEWG